ncbi:MAG: pantetheine-phosphate adenylyltransferase [Syntrophomonadaceae bacterium]
MRLAVYPGSFDPVTNGHIDILERSSQLFDRIIIAVIHNVSKKSLFSLDERVNLIRESTQHLGNIEVDCFSGLLVNYLARKNARIIIRGLRSVADFEYECQMSMMNKRLMPDVDTVFVMSNNDFTYVSSSMVKEVALLGGDVTSLVPEPVQLAFSKKIAELSRGK